MTQQKQVSDAAKRVSDQYNLHRIADPHESIGKWFMAALHDGTSDGVLYHSKSAAVNHAHHNEKYYAFVQVGPWPMSPEQSQTYLDLHRRMYDAGLRMADPDAAGGGHEMIKRVSAEDQYNQIRALFVGDRAPSNLILPGVN